MKLRDFKYLLAFSLPLLGWIGLNQLGVWSWSVVLLAFGVIPLMEVVLGGNEANYAPEEEARLNSLKWFDYLLYLNLPILAYLTYTYFGVITTASLTSAEWWGLTISQGLLIGSMGINVAHEIGHRNGAFHEWVSRLLLTMGLYTHFTIEHNLGHHKWVGTPKDPSTARFGEMIYVFWFRSVTGVYLKAWKLEISRLARAGSKIWHPWHNKMILNHALTAIYLTAVWWFFGSVGLVAALLIGVIGFLLLESVNYIEHYGLRRKQFDNGRFERVDNRHSWNSNHDLGRIFLFELTRHSDHHFKASKKYQILRNYDDSPQLPLGYPASILLALVPPLWFWRMNPHVRQIDQLSSQAA